MATMRAAISRGHVLDRAPVHLRLDVAHQQAVENVRRPRARRCSPSAPAGPRCPSGSTGSSCCTSGFCVMVLTNCALHQEQPVDLALAIGIEHHLDGADQILDVRPVAEARDAGEDRQRPRRRKNAQALGADDAQAHAARPCPATRASASDVCLKTLAFRPPAQAAIGGDDDDADRLRLALDQERMAVIRDWPRSGGRSRCASSPRTGAPAACAPARGASCSRPPSPWPW